MVPNFSSNQKDHLLMSANSICFIASARSIHTRRWVRAFAARDDYEVTLLSPSGPPPPESDLGDAEVISFQPPSREQPRFQRYASVVHNYWNIRRHVLQQGFDIAHVHQLPQPATVPFFWRLPRLVVSTWGSDTVDFKGRPRNRLRDPSRRFILKQAEVITSTSEFLAEATRAYAPRDKTIHVVPFGIDLNVFRPNPEASPPPRPVRLIIAKHLRPKYGIHHLLQAMRIIVDSLKDVELTVVGEGPQRSELEALTDYLGLQDVVRFVGRVPHNRVVSLLQGSHIFVMPSVNDSETFGVAAAEAEATALPVVATRVGGVPEVVIDGETGLLVPPGDVDALAAALLHLIEHRGLRSRMGKAGREHIERHYDWHPHVLQMHRIYQALLGRIAAR